MNVTTLDGGQPIWCLRPSEARVLDSHVRGYFDHGVGVGPGATLVDVGANIGVFAVRVAKENPGARVIALEPIPEIFDVLVKNAADHGAGAIVAVRCGAAASPGRARFTYFPRSPALSTSDPSAWDEDPDEFTEAVAGASRHAPMWYARLVPRALAGWVARHLRAAKVEVDAELRPLSDVLDEHRVDRVDLLKVDCEGAELPALQGLREPHWAAIRQVVCEVHDRDGRLDTILGMLRDHGFARVTVAKEAGFERTRLVNVYALREAA